MWIAKLKAKHDDCPIVNRCQKFNIIVFSYPSVWYDKKKNKFATTTCYFQTSNEEKKQNFITDLKTDKKITNIEHSGDIFTYEINLGKEGEHVMLYHTKQILFVKPTINHHDGFEYWEVAAWKREDLEKFIKELKGHMDSCEILKIESSKLTDIYFPNITPKLSASQKKAIALAYENGYYNYPRKITVVQLSKLANVGISTFQEHLRKAELKLLPAIIEKTIKKDNF